MTNDVEIVVKVKNKASEGFAAVRAEATRTAASIGKALDHIGRQGGGSRDFGLGQLPGQAAAGSAALGQLGGAASSASNSLGLTSISLGSVAKWAGIAIGGFLGLVPAIYSTAAAAGAAATALVGLSAVGTILDSSIGGVADAWTAYGQQQTKAAAGGGGAASQMAGNSRQVENASRSLTDAKRAEKDADDAVNRAREQEIQRLRDLALAQRTAVLDQKDAFDALQKAKQAAQAGNDSGMQDVEYHNQLAEAVERAQIAYDEATNKASDLKKEVADGNRKGVNGSDAVKSALEQQRQAVERVTQAQEALADAQKKVGTSAGGAAGGVNVFNQAMAKLSPNARSVVMALIDVSKQWDVVKRKFEDRLFDGVAGSIRDMATKWFPVLGPLLDSTATHLSNLGKSLMAALSSNDFIAGISAALKAFGPVIDDISAGANALVDAFGRVAGKSGPALRVISTFIRDIFIHFDNWIKTADKSGKLESFLADAAKSLGQVLDIGGTALKIVGQIIQILFPSSKKASSGILDGLQESLHSISDWLGNGANQRKIQDIIDRLGRGISAMIKFALIATKAFEAVGESVDWIKRKWNALMGWFDSLPGRVTSLGSRLWHGITEGFRSALNWIIGKWNSLQFGIPSFDLLGQHFGGGSAGVPRIPYLATGGISQGLAVINERGGEVVRTPRGSTVLSHGDSVRALDSAGGGGGPITVNLVVDGKTLARAIVSPMRNLVRTEGQGSVRKLLQQNPAVA